jgi:hypothetical protein
VLENPAGLVYGVLITGALLDAESVANENYGDTIAGVVTAMLLVWLAHAYADYVGHRMAQRETLRPSELFQALRRGTTVLLGAAVPLAVLVGCWIKGAPLNTAVSVGIYTEAATLVVIELAAGLRAHLSGVALLFQTLMGGLLGALIIALKLILH